MSGAYYNEIDPRSAAWLRELIKRGHIAAGDVDERSIEDVYPDDLRDYTQCHFFAGIGGWSLALRMSGWDDSRPVWTGSCPCQPFSAAGARKGFADERHLWPAFFHLIEQCRPAVVFGEQVASRDGLAWLDLVHADLEAARYAFGAADLCAAGFGAPHIRQRLYWVADASESGRQSRGRSGGAGNGGDEAWIEPGRLCDVGGLADDIVQQRQDGQPGFSAAHDTSRRLEGAAEAARLRDDLRPGPTNGFWRAADWLGCRDGKWRPVEPGTFPLAHGLPARVGRLRGYGNAIVPQVAAAFIRARGAPENSCGELISA